MHKIYSTIALSVFFITGAFAQTFNPVIDTIINNVNLDTLIKNVRNLSGEDNCQVYGQTKLIRNRSTSVGRTDAADYIKEQLEKYGYEPYFQEYSGSGKNIICQKTGSVYPDQYFIIGGHYDAVTEYCADDDISGVSAMLEAARLMAGREFKYSVIFAAWDEEEIGLLGSKAYASFVKNENMDIRGVYQCEMMGWDSDNDWLIDVHVKNIANSTDLSGALVAVDDVYNLKLKMGVYNPGVTSSDHSPFWDEGIGAIAFSQAYYGGDVTPHYHKNTDRISAFNIPYFHELVKLAVGTISTMAEPYDPNGPLEETMVVGRKTVTGCAGVLFDNGGANGNYGDGNDYYVTIASGSASQVEIQFTEFEIEPGDGSGNEACNYDWLKIYDGEDENSPILGLHCNSDKPTLNSSIISTGEELTIHLHADELENLSGFRLEWTCTTLTGMPFEESEVFGVYPNPASDNIQILGEGLDEIRLINTLGETVGVFHVNESQRAINISNYRSGVYLVVMRTKKDQYIRKLIID